MNALYRGAMERVPDACDVMVTRMPAPTFHRVARTATRLFSVPGDALLTLSCKARDSPVHRPQRISGLGALTFPRACTAAVRGAVLTADSHYTSAFEAGDTPFILPNLPAGVVANYSLGLAALPEDQQRQVAALLNHTWGFGSTSAGCALHWASTLCTGSILFIGAMGLILYCYCCQGCVSASSNFSLMEMAVKIIRTDILNISHNIPLAHCVSSNFSMSRGLAKLVKLNYGGTIYLRTYAKPQLGSIGVVSGEGRIIFNLITKERYFEKPDTKWIDFTLSILEAYCEHIPSNN